MGNYDGRYYSIDPIDGDDIDDIVNWQLNGGRRGGIHSSGPDLCPNPEHAGPWHGGLREIVNRRGRVTGECPGSHCFYSDGTRRNP